MSHESTAVTAATARQGLARGARARGWLLAPGRGLALCGLMLAGAALLLAVATAVTLTGLAFLAGGPHTARDLVLGTAGLAALGCLLPRALLAARWLASRTRQLAGEWCGVPIADPYLPPPAGGAKPGYRDRLRWLWADPATRRDLLWLLVNPAGAWLLAAAPAALVLSGLVAAFAHRREVFIPLAVVLIATGLAAGPWLLRAYGLVARSLLGPAGRAELAVRVQHLAQTRAETIDSGAAEIRRIERDLHDGAQARLVAMGMTLDAAGQLIGSDPAAARALVLEARDASARALAELRDLVRGIHPPVLADRGLADAVRALALDSPLRVQLTGELAGRPPAPVESAAYFAVSELLANATRHAGAGQVRIDIRHERGALRIGVSDDGCGGADPARGSGLRGIERRLAAFDGVLAVSSPPGGPTAVTMEIPCGL